MFLIPWPHLKMDYYINVAGFSPCLHIEKLKADQISTLVAAVKK